MAGVSPTAPLNQGGIFHAIVGTFIEVGIAIAVSVPLGIGTAVYMSEVGGRFSRLVRTVVEAMTALPEILAGLFVYVTLIVEFGLPKSGHRGVQRDVGHDGADHRAGGRGGAARRAERAARGEPRPRRLAVADGPQGRAAERASRASPPRRSSASRAASARRPWC